MLKMRKFKFLGVVVYIRVINCYCIYVFDIFWFVGNVRVKFIYIFFLFDIFFKCCRKLFYL